MNLELSEQQKNAVEESGNVLVTACPGSGKTRVLIHRIIKDLSELESTKHRILAVTFTNRAADEIKARLKHPEILLNQLWTGTIHSFSLEWILRPYACYSNYLKKGFSVVDEFYIKSLKNKLKKKHRFNSFDEINTRINRNGKLSACSEKEKLLRNEYYKILKDKKLIDFDMALYLAYDLIIKKKEIAKTLGSIFYSICIDEYQDTQDLQYGILSEIVKNSSGFSKLFVVGDANQAIYSSLGGMPKNKDEIKDEFNLEKLVHHKLTGNYRSSQRIIDLSQNLLYDEIKTTSLTNFANDHGVITYSNQEYDQKELPKLVANMIEYHVNNGVPSNEICVLAPQWWQITNLGRQLVALLPDIEFDAPGLSLLHNQRENIWFKISRLFLCEPEPRLYITRLRWAGSIISELEQIIGSGLPEEYQTARRFLRLINSIKSIETDGIAYLEDVFQKLMIQLRVDLNTHSTISEHWNSFFENAKDRLNNVDFNIKNDIISLKKMFKRPGGVVVTSCHSIKGEEYETVICFGLLKGYIPNWDLIYNNTQINENLEASKLLYVIVSRAKKNIHLISESGRKTRRGSPYETNSNIKNVCFEYNVLDDFISQSQKN